LSDTFEQSQGAMEIPFCQFRKRLAFGWLLAVGDEL
jgi:hypothetical protein